MLKKPDTLVLIILCLLLGSLTACVNEQVIHANAVPISSAQQQIVEERLFDVGIAIFDPGLPQKNNAKENLNPEIRKAEARYIPYTLKKTLQETAHWGLVRLVPDNATIVDVLVTGKVVESNGSELILDIEARDASGNTWLAKQYSGTASKYAYGDDHYNEQDPFQTVYNSIATDLLAAREQLTVEALENIRSIAELRFASDLSPDIFENYLKENPTGKYRLNRLPAEDDPMLRRVRSIRARDDILLDTLDGEYTLYYQTMKPAYREWRQLNFEETVAKKKLQRSARNRMGMGAAAVAAGVAGGINSGSTAGQVVSAATAVGGAAVFVSGVEKYNQSQIHAEALLELNTSFAADVAPRVVELEGRTVTLTGSAEAQYQEWRRLLQKIFIEETGLQSP